MSVSVEIAVSLAVITSNHGLEGLSPLFEQLLGSPSALTANYIASSDTKRIKKAVQKAGYMSQRRRKSAWISRYYISVHLVHKLIFSFHVQLIYE